jgi:hypothetical protein
MPERWYGCGAGYTPIQFGLPDAASTEEVNGQYWWGLLSLSLGALLTVTLLLGALVSFSGKRWSATSN